MARAAAAAVALACTLTTTPAAGQAGPPSDPRCLPLATGSTGLLLVGGSVPTGATLQRRPGGLGAPVPAATAARLPDAVVFRTPSQTFSTEYAFLLRDGRILVRPAVAGRGVLGQPWRALELPDCLEGRITAISADGRLLLALAGDRQLYAHDMPGGDLSSERWTWRWGPYFWTGAGLRMFGDVRTWAASELTSGERFTDTAGRERTPLGVATVYLLRGDGRRITYLDPWLPADDSREVCGPRRGTVPLASLAASGSTVFAASRRGELFTRLYDFDVSGANTVFGRYSWQQGRPADDARWQLPAPGWVRHARPPGVITDRLTIARTGPTSADRVLRVAGRDRRGRAGWWEKPIAATGVGAWRFTVASGVLGGRRLPLPGAPARVPGTAPIRFAGAFGGAPAEVLDFDPVCSPALLRVRVTPDGPPLDLVLHTSDGMRQETRAAGLDDTPREYNGAIEVPAAAFASLPAGDPRRAWIDAQLGGRRIATAPVAVTRTRLRFLAQCAELTRDGAPARPDVPRVPLDLGAAVGRATEQAQDGRPARAC